MQQQPLGGISRTLMLLGCFCWSAGQIMAQSDSTSLPTAIQQIAPPKASPLKATLGLGAGMFAFFGDIGNDHEQYSPLLAKPAFDLRASVPLNDWLEGSLYALHGRLSMNERTPSRNLNFESRITVLKRELSAPVADQKLGFSMYLL